MRRPAKLGLATAVALLAVSAPLVVIALNDDGPPAPPVVRTVPGCPQAPGSVYVTPVHLVADLEHLVVRDSRWVAPTIAAADGIVGGTIPVVRPPAAGDGGDPLRYLYDEGVALRRSAGVLGLAYASTDDPRYLDALAAQTVAAARWPDWNPKHSLDTAQVATAVALGYTWSRDRMTAGERREVTSALVNRLLAPYTCQTGTDLAFRRTSGGNQATVIGTAAVLAGLAVRSDEPAWSAAAVEAGASRCGAPRRRTAPGSRWRTGRPSRA